MFRRHRKTRLSLILFQLGTARHQLARYFAALTRAGRLLLAPRRELPRHGCVHRAGPAVSPVRQGIRLESSMPDSGSRSPCQDWLALMTICFPTESVPPFVRRKSHDQSPSIVGRRSIGENRSKTHPPQRFARPPIHCCPYISPATLIPCLHRMLERSSRYTLKTNTRLQ